MTSTLPPHSAAKHFLLDRYLKAWFPIVCTLPTDRILYLDGFAGKGRYGHRPGSPLIALNALLQHRAYSRMQDKQFGFWFVEKSRQASEELRQTLDGMQLPSHVKTRVERERFTNVVGAFITELATADAPSFAFLDPFGFSHTPMAVIQRFAAYPRTEVLITFIFEHLNRFLCKDDARLRAQYNELFGTAEWEDACKMGGVERHVYLHNLYERQLRSIGFHYVTSFAMLDTKNHIEYYLFFGTNHVLGLERMKEAMWMVDPSGQFRFSDRGAGQLKLFPEEPNLAGFRSRVLRRFAGESVAVDDLLCFAAEDPHYLPKHMRALLSKFEDEGKLAIIAAKPGRRKDTFPEGIGMIVRLDR